MSKLSELISELCPDGVEYKRLDEICLTITTGKLNVNKKTENGIYPFFTCDATPYKIDTYAFDTEAILVSGNGNGHINYYNGKFNAYQRTYVLCDFNHINVRYLLHYLRGYLGKYIFVNSKKGTIPYITLPILQAFEVPVPPLPIQAEIVRILDNFTQLTAELTAELTARKKQYEYYHDLLLDFKDADTIRLCELFETRNGYTPSKSNKDYWNTYDVPWFRMDDIRTNGHILNKAIQGISKDALKKGKPFPANSIIISTSATIGEYALITCDFLCNQRFTCLTIKNEYKDMYDIKFIFYYCYKLSAYCKNYLNKGNFASVDMTRFNAFEFPIVPLDRQKEIVGILDRFDALCNDLTRGLPAEIAARQKQYEYYRDKLLTFKQKED